jgi:hypothetical protein
MNKEQISWLIVRAFGIYLLLQALMLVPELTVGLYAARAYSNFVSSLSSDNNNLASTARQATSLYRSFWFAPLLRCVLFTAAGMYLLRGGGFLVRLLQHVPDTPRDDTKPRLTEQEANEMSFKERLSTAGLFEEFADAVEHRDVPELERILRQIYLTPDDIQTVIAQMLGTSA